MNDYAVFLLAVDINILGTAVGIFGCSGYALVVNTFLGGFPEIVFISETNPANMMLGKLFGINADHAGFYGPSSFDFVNHWLKSVPLYTNVALPIDPRYPAYAQVTKYEVDSNTHRPAVDKLRGVFYTEPTGEITECVLQDRESTYLDINSLFLQDGLVTGIPFRYISVDASTANAVALESLLPTLEYEQDGYKYLWRGTMTYNGNTESATFYNNALLVAVDCETLYKVYYPEASGDAAGYVIGLLTKGEPTNPSLAYGTLYLVYISAAAAANDASRGLIESFWLYPSKAIELTGSGITAGFKILNADLAKVWLDLYSGTRVSSEYPAHALLTYKYDNPILNRLISVTTD